MAIGGSYAVIHYKPPVGLRVLSGFEGLSFRGGGLEG